MRRLAWIASTLLASWLGMQAVHELGHVLVAAATGGRIERVVLHPFTLSRTDLSLNPHPVAVAWGGPLFGTMAPVVALAIAQYLQMPGAFVLRFFAGFCLVANGAYFASGALTGIGDAADVLKQGGQAWPMVLFGVLAVPLGFRLWHGLGPHFGLGKDARPIDRGVLSATCAWCVAQMLFGFWIGGD